MHPSLTLSLNLERPRIPQIPFFSAPTEAGEGIEPMSLDKEGPGKTSVPPSSWSGYGVNPFQGESHRTLSQSSFTMMSLQSPTPVLLAKLLKGMVSVFEKSPFFELFAT